MTLAAGLLAAPLWLAALAAGPKLDEAGAAQKITVDVRGPVALVQVTRTLAGDGRRGVTEHEDYLLRNDTPDEHDPDGPRPDTTRERVLDLALPEGAALVDLAFSEHGKWRSAAVTAHEPATKDYVDRLEQHGRTPRREPVDESTSLRVRVACDRSASVELRYRFALLPETFEGRHRIRFPASPEATPAPADVVIAGAADVAIAGVRAARGHVSARGAWEISWASAGTAKAARLDGTLAFAKVSAGRTLAAVSVETRAGKAAAPPPSVLLLVDRSRSVGLPGLAAERDLAGRLLEALPPSTRFDALFFDRQVRRLFPMTRPATREALAAVDAEMVPDKLQNGTDLLGALRDAGALLRREASAFAPRAWLVLVTDGALPDGGDGAAFEHALGATPGVDLTLATFVVRPAGDEPAPAPATRALRQLAAAHGGVLRELAANELGEALPPALEALARGGDAAEVRVVAGGGEHALAARLAPGEGRSALLDLATRAPGAAEVVATAGGTRVRVPLRARAVDAAWLGALAAPRAPSPARLYVSGSLLALVETPARAAPPAEDAPKGSLDRTVVRNTLALAYMPRARACYLSRTAATPALRDLAGRVRLAIDLTRGEVGNVVVQSSTLNHAGIEACLRDGAFELDVPRTLRSDSPSTAVLNLVFRPRTPEKHATPEEAALGEQIDLVIEELRRAEGAVEETPPPDRSMIPTR